MPPLPFAPVGFSAGRQSRVRDQVRCGSAASPWPGATPPSASPGRTALAPDGRSPVSIRSILPPGGGVVPVGEGRHPGDDEAERNGKDDAV